MNLIKDTMDLYKNSYLLTIMNITYHNYNYLLCLIYLFWYLYNISNIHKFTNENYVNNYLIFYSFYKINYFVKNMCYNITQLGVQFKTYYTHIIIDIMFSIIYIGIFIFDFKNNNNIYIIQYWIFYSILINVFIFIYGTLYLIIKMDFRNNTIDMIDFTA